jgi:hypothetical protein
MKEEFINFFDSQSSKFIALTKQGASRIANIANTGYSPTYAQKNLINPLFKYLRNQGLSLSIIFHHDPRVGLNANLFTATAVLSTQTVTLAIGTYTFWFASGAGSITSSNGTGTASNHGAVSEGGTRTITVTVAGSFTFTVSGAVNNAQLEIGSSATVYNLRVDTTALKLNNLVNDATGDGTFVNGTPANMTVVDATAGEVLNYVSASSQGVTLANSTYYTSYTVLIWVKVNNLASNRVPFVKGSARDRIVLQTDGAIRVNSATGGTTSATGQVVANTWVHIAVTMTTTNTETFKNGVSVISGAITRVVESTDPYYLVNSALAPLDGLIGESTLVSQVLTPTQILAIYNIQKARYGL